MTQANEYLEVNANGEPVTYLGKAKPIGKRPSIATTNRAYKPSGYIIYRGPSLLDGKPIVVVAVTRESKNKKTGKMVQTYVLVDNGISPVQNARSLADSSVCGDCKHRRGVINPETGKGGPCYVNLGQGARSVMDGVVRGIYPDVSNNPVAMRELAVSIAQRMVRLGTYGDPMAAPAQVWRDLVAFALGHTGYTHQWRNKAIPVEQVNAIKALCMASADTLGEKVRAESAGWRTFRVQGLNEDTKQKNEMACPASEEQGKRLTCDTCMACSGGVDSKKASVVIIVHGSLKNRFEGARA